jgi:serine/threonine protein phosphatase PrpC
VFLETERAIDAAGVNLASSGTTAAVAYQQGNQLWVAAVGDSRVILCSKTAQGAFRCQPLTLDHRPRRPSEMER